MPYLKYAVMSVLETRFEDLELIVSLDDTEDGSREFLASIKDNRITVVKPSNSLSMSEHWDFAQTHATGQWQMFLGQDDMMIKNYVHAFDVLSKKAEDLGIGVIVARRAYVCWPPLEVANLKALQYWRTDEVSVRDSHKFLAKALLSSISYHAGPQMYTTTIVSKAIIDSIRTSNSGRLILGHPQDAYLAAALLKQTPSFLFSGQPFSWVGTSSKSAGLAITKMASGAEEYGQLADEYLQSVQNSKSISYTSKLDFRHGINARYFLDALRDIWPDVLKAPRLSSLWFELRFDGNILALADRAKGIGLDSKSLLMAPGWYWLKRLVSWCIVVSQLNSRIVATFASVALRLFKPKTLAFSSIKSIRTPEDLFQLAKQSSVAAFRLD